MVDCLLLGLLIDKTSLLAYVLSFHGSFEVELLRIIFKSKLIAIMLLLVHIADELLVLYVAHTGDLSLVKTLVNVRLSTVGGC